MSTIACPQCGLLEWDGQEASQVRMRLCHPCRIELRQLAREAEEAEQDRRDDLRRSYNE